MNVFIIGSPLETAKALDKRRLSKQIVECEQMLAVYENRKTAWYNHPCTRQYAKYASWLHSYKVTLERFRDNEMTSAHYWNNMAEQTRPAFHTEEFFNQMKRRLYTKDPVHYAQWAGLGKSEENWYWSPCENGIIKYVNGKRIK